VVRSSRSDGPPQPVPQPEFELLREQTHETVMATYCPQGHVNPPYAPTCRVCQTAIARQDPQRAPRPLLGRLRLPTGETVPFDRGVVLGRKPVPVNPHAPSPHLVAVPQEASFVSRMHLQIELDGWLVICRDLGSRGGTTLSMPGRAPERLRAMEPHVLEPGCRVSLADQYEVAYEVTP
jgi:FHA domain-containing protein